MAEQLDEALHEVFNCASVETSLSLTGHVTSWLSGYCICAMGPLSASAHHAHTTCKYLTAIVSVNQLVSLPSLPPTLLQMMAVIDSHLAEGMQDRLLRVRARAWGAKLKEPVGNVVWKRNRNAHARLLLAQLECGCFEVHNASTQTKCKKRADCSCMRHTNTVCRMHVHVYNGSPRLGWCFLAACLQAPFHCMPPDGPLPTLQPYMVYRHVCAASLYCTAI